MSDAGAIYRETSRAVEATNAVSRLALELAVPLTRLLADVPELDELAESDVVEISTTVVEIRKARAALELISDPDW